MTWLPYAAQNSHHMAGDVLLIFLYYFQLNVVVVWLALLLRIRDVPSRGYRLP
jgi:hypothetical protein